MIYYDDGTVFNTNAKTLVNTVNCFGVMGAGIALEFKLRYPEMFKDYENKCEQKEIKIGRPRLFKHSEDIWIMNFPTKNHWRNPSKMSYIEEGLKYFVENYKKANIESIAFPKLGTSNGGLDWIEVKDMMERYLKEIDIDVYICLDEKEEAEGIEGKMVNELNRFTNQMLINEIGLTKSQADIIKNSIPIMRFWKLGKLKGIGRKTYERLFNYFYKKNVCFENNNKMRPQVGEQLSLF